MLKRCMALMVLTAILGACGPSRDGELLWQFEIKKSHMQWGVVDAGRLYLCADDVYCLDIATGRLLWEFKTFGTHASAPVIDDGRLYFQCGGLYALDAATGSMLWEFWTNEWASSAPVVDAGRVYAPVGERLYCLDALAGKQLWVLKTAHGAATPVAIGGMCCFGDGETIFCVDGVRGQVVWQFEVGSDRVQLARAGGMLLSCGRGGIARAHRIETGQVQWQLDTDSPLVRFSMVPSGQVLLSAGALYCLDAHSGEQVWMLRQDGLYVLDARALGHDVIARGFGYGLFCVGLRDGKFMYRMNLPDGVRLLTDETAAIFLPGSQSRTVKCVSVSPL